ncbi:MAG TPA: Gfo/Idh/MocA family oxidoreductase, partial [Limnochordia bacterium]|nr:Gfo/Idh/MocA family oxidoreductase [Limnochordia bacterium]
MKRVKTGIIGCGKGAHLHAKALMSLPESAFTAVYSRNLATATAFAKQYDVQAYASIEEMATVGGVEAVVVCTPHPSHAEVTVKAAEAGMHVLVEKPLASTLKDCDTMIRTAKENGVLLGTVCQRRFYHSSMRLWEAIAAGKIGRPLLG